MKLVFYSLVLNHHQACVADEFYDILGDDYAFVETAECHDRKGATEDYSKRPYLVMAWESAEAWQHAMELAGTADVCVFGGYEALPFEKARMKRGLLSFDMGERMLKRGWLNLASPRILKMIMAYHFGGWRKKPMYKLCCSSFAKGDQYKLRSFEDKCYKWGYFTQVEDLSGSNGLNGSSSSTLEWPKALNPLNCSSGFEPLEPTHKVRLMWCARLLKLKHPELVVEMAQRLKAKGYSFVVDVYGDEGNAAASEEIYPLASLKLLSEDLDVCDVVSIHGSKPNKEIIEAMKRHDVFLFTSNNREGWGAVVNESMSNGCAVVASDAIGSTAYLVTDGFNGFAFRSEDVENLTEKVEWLLTHPENLERMKRNAYERMRDMWSPRKAAESLLLLIENLKQGKDTPIAEGPCSKA